MTSARKDPIQIPQAWNGRMSGLSKWCWDVLATLREIRDFLLAQASSGSSSGEATAVMGETIDTGDAIHVTAAGIAYKAVATDPTRFCTDWATSVDHHKRTVVLGGLDAELKFEALTGTDCRVFLAGTPGKVTDYDPYKDRAGKRGQVRQFLGFRRGALSTNGRARVKFAPGGPDGIGVSV